MKLTFCLLCKDSRLTTAVALRPTPIADEYVPKALRSKPQPGYPLTLMLCDRCGHVQLNYLISPKRLYQNYIYQTVSSPGLTNHYKDFAKELTSTSGKQLFVIEIGSNDGTLLKELKKRGIIILGIDPAQNIAEKASKQGIPTIPQFFSLKLARKIRKDHGPANVVTANNVLANVKDVDDFIEGVKAVLSSNGLFIFETFYLKDLIQNKVFDFIFHEHYSYFAVKPLALFFKRHGMEIVDVVHIPTKGGSIRVTVQNTNGPHKISHSVKQFVTAESQLALQNIETFRSFEKFILQTKNELSTLLKRIKKKKKIIAGFGASASTTTLIYEFNLKDVLSFIIDENPIKLSTFSPGYHIPVVSSEEIYKQKPDYIILLAWRFGSQIIEKNKKFLELGGHFIKPLPVLQVI